MSEETINRPDSIRLVEIGPENVRSYRRLAVAEHQQGFVADVTASLADAQVPEIIDGAPVVPWYRGVEADGVATGFVMVALTTEHHPEPYLWRLLVDHAHQRRGIGRTTLDLVCAELIAMGDRALLTSWVDGPGSPRGFYEAYGFVPTGQVIEGEVEGRLEFPAS